MQHLTILPYNEPVAALPPIRSNTFTMEWPPRSGRMQQFSEVDRAEWCDIPVARMKINAAQTAFLDELAAFV